MRAFRFGATVFLFISSLFLCTAALNQKECLDRLQSSGNSTLGLDRNGQSVSNASDAVAISYHNCLEFCPGGKGQEPFDWSVFSQQFAAWLLPWLALLSQLPFGATLKVDNFMSMILTLGSPTLAAYSLILTTLNGYHVASQFSGVTFPNAKYAVRVLAGLQQAPLRIITEEGLLASLIVLPQNDKWWVQMSSLIDYQHTWSVSALSGISWVIMAYLLTVIDSFSEVSKAINSNGQGVGSLWLWLLAIVVGWLIISPKCDAEKLQNALSEANDNLAHTGQDDGAAVQASSPSSGVGSRRAMTFARSSTTPLYDEVCSPPIYNYARIFSWSACIDEVVSSYHAATERSESKIPVDNNIAWKLIDDAKLRIHPNNRRGTKEQLTDYCAKSEADLKLRKTRWGRDVFSRMAKASAIAIFLQWCTTGAAIIVVWFTPTTGLGCRSGAYLLYALVSTLVWACMILSSILGHYAVTPSTGSNFTTAIPLLNRAHRRFHRAATLPVDAHGNIPKSHLSERFAASLSVVLNATGKVLAALNSIWIMCACLFQFTNVFNRCICNSSVYGRGAAKAYNVLTLSHSDELAIQHAWIGGVALALVSVFLFVGFIWIYHRPPQPRS